MVGKHNAKDGDSQRGLPPPPPANPPGMEKYAPAYACCMLLGLSLIAWGLVDNIVAGWTKDFSKWEPATCLLESVQVISTHTSWDPLGFIDPQRLGTHASWGLGVYAIVMVNVTENAAGATARENFVRVPMTVESSLMWIAVVAQIAPVGRRAKEI